MSDVCSSDLPLPVRRVAQKLPVLFAPADVVRYRLNGGKFGAKRGKGPFLTAESDSRNARKGSLQGVPPTIYAPLAAPGGLPITARQPLCLTLFLGVP